MAAAAMPIVMCGSTKKEIMDRVTEGLKPEYEVIHLITSLEQGKSDLPSLLRRQPAPKAVLVGGIYDGEAVAAMQEACKGVDDGVPWVVHSRDEVISGPPGPGDVEAVLKRAKAKLDEVVGGGKRGVWRY